MRIRVVLATAAVACTTGLVLGGCSLIGTSSKAAATTSASAAPSVTAPPSTYSPLSGPVEDASVLPKECSGMLSTTQLQAVFGPGLPIGDNYGSYAALPSIGRTGRVVCVFGVGIDSFGHQSSGALEVSVATYTSPADAVGRAADTVQSDSNAGATTATVSVGGHPATIVVEPPASAPSTTPATPGTTASASPGAPASAGASPAATASASPGETQLVMADGNRTFVLQIPFGKISAQQAVTALTTLAMDVYSNTLPPRPASGYPVVPSPSAG